MYQLEDKKLLSSEKRRFRFRSGNNHHQVCYNKKICFSIDRNIDEGEMYQIFNQKDSIRIHVSHGSKSMFRLLGIASLFIAVVAWTILIETSADKSAR